MVFITRRKFRRIYMIPLIVVGYYVLGPLGLMRFLQSFRLCAADKDLQLANQESIIEVQSKAWFNVDDDNHAFVFSAYYHARSPNDVTIFGAVTGNSKFFCQLGYSSHTKTMKEVLATVHAYINDQDQSYQTCNFKCRLPNEDIPITVAVVTKRGQISKRWIPVKEIKKAAYERNFTVCLKPLHSRYGRAYQLVEWIEIHKLLGADKFVIYNFSSEANVVKVLNYYSKQGLVDVVQWPFPTTDISEHSAVLSVNECLYRIREKSRFLVFVDLDEFIIPHTKKSTCWNDMLKELPNEGAYIFKNVFYRTDYNVSERIYSGREIAEQFRLTALLYLRREERELEPNVRSKYIVRTDAVEDLDTNYVENMRPGFQSYIVPTVIGYKHHYTGWIGCTINYGEVMLADSTMIAKYSDSLIDNVSKVWSKLHNVKLVVPNEKPDFYKKHIV